MAKKLFLLAPLMLLAACHEAKPEAQNPIKAALSKCGELGAHAESIACKEDLAAKAVSEVDQLVAQYLAVAKRLDAEYRSAFKSSTPPPDSFESQARDSQEAWARYAKRQCEFEEGTSFGGSGGGDFGAECRLRLNKQRADDLRTALQLASRPLDPK